MNATRSGPHNAGRLALHVAKAMLEEMTADQGAGFRRIGDLGRKMADEVRRVARVSNRRKIVVQGINSMFQILFTAPVAVTDYRDFCGQMDRARFRDFVRRLMDKGIYLNPSAMSSE